MWALLLLSPLLMPCSVSSTCSVLFLPILSSFNASRFVQHALIGGNDASPGQFPYQVLTRGLDKDPLRNFGTGALIHPEWVLTNAESVAEYVECASGVRRAGSTPLMPIILCVVCVFSLFSYVALMVTLGVVDRDSTDASRQDIPALNVFVHPKWPGQWVWLQSHRNDVGLVQLTRPAKLNGNSRHCLLSPPPLVPLTNKKA